MLGRGSVQRRDRDGFVAMSLEPGWQLRRRVYGGQTLSHMYFASDGSLSQLSRPAETATALSPGRAGYGSGPISLRVIPFRP
ncbi:DUF3747 domain-containing protein [Cyanobium sp. ATX-6F1]|uniref:DUF3747 domain-containing protein n=1 Tax=Cyanobium sp. ATX-6F1 TaxID=3137388 RepID=UPI0039BE2805